jgi:hypothetical protein
VGEVKNSLEGIFEVVLSLFLHTFIKLFSSFNENGTHNTSSLHSGQHMSHKNWRGECTLGKAPALIVFAALKDIPSIVDNQLVGHSLDNIENDQECVPADIPAHLHVKLQLKSFSDFILPHFTECLAIFIFLDVPLFKVALSLKKQTQQVDKQE